MTFSEALEAAKNAHRIQRAGWNGKGMWVAHTPAMIVTLDCVAPGSAAARLAHELLTTDALASHPRPRDRSIVVCGHLDLRMADGALMVGWMPNQADLLADDWSVLD